MIHPILSQSFVLSSSINNLKDWQLTCRHCVKILFGCLLYRYCAANFTIIEKEFFYTSGTLFDSPESLRYCTNKNIYLKKIFVGIFRICGKSFGFLRQKLFEHFYYFVSRMHIFRRYSLRNSLVRQRKSFSTR